MQFAQIPKKAVLVSFALALLFPTLIILLLSPLLEHTMIERGKEDAYKEADHLNHTMRITPEDMAPGADSERVKSEFDFARHTLDIYEICVIRPDGSIAYSTTPGQAGQMVTPELFKAAVEQSRRHAVFTPRGSLSSEGFILDSDIIEAYVPITHEGVSIGTMVVYYDVTRIRQSFLHIKIIFGAVLFVVSFLAMLLVSALIVRGHKQRAQMEQTEEELEMEQMKAETVFSSMGDNVIIQDRDYKIVYQNKVNRDVFGLRTGEQCHAVYEGLDHICPGCPVELTYRDGGIHKQEKEVTTPKGLVHFELTASPLRNSAGEIIAGIKVVRDVSDKRKLEDQLRHSQKMEAIGALTSGISHEFNNLLTSIIGFSEIMLDETEEGSLMRSYASAIYQSGRRAEELTRGLLAYSRKQITDKTPILLNQTVRDVQYLLTHIAGPDIQLILKLRQEEVLIMADRGQIEQVIVNTATNARDAMPGGGTITISTSTINADDRFIAEHRMAHKGREYVLMSIRDTGKGMDKETIDKIFEPFFTTKDIGKGTGLGLSIVYGIIMQHGGFIEAESEPGQGTEFKIYLPTITNP